MIDSLGARSAIHGTMRTFGLVAHREGASFAITSQDAAAFETYRAPGMELPAHRLVRAVSIAKLPGPPGHDAYSIGELAHIEKLLDVTVRRFDPDFGCVQGVVTAMRGATRIHTADSKLVVQGLIEISFDQIDSETARATPSLVAGDSGALITTWDGRVVGVLVAGSGNLGYAAPLADFLASNQLEHAHFQPHANLPWEEIGRHIVQKRAGIASFGAELARETSLGLDDIPEAA